MLTGRVPFEAKTSQGMLSAHVMEVPKDPRERRPGIPQPLAEAVLKCLAKHPADRWQKAEDLRAQLETMLATPSGGMTPTDTRPFQATSARPPVRSWRWIGIAAAIGLSVVAAATYALTSGGGDQIQRIGVMPIEDISGQDALFVTAMHDALTNGLAQLGVGVASRTDMVRYAGGGKSTREIAAEQNLDAIVETTVFRAGDVIRITVQFSDPATTRSLWAANYSPNVTDVLSAQGAVVDSIRTGIGTALGVTGNPGGME
jgi:TolB-like protein